MQFQRGLLAALTAGALALGGCGHETREDDDVALNEQTGVGSVSMALTLPDDSEVTDVAYTITGPNNFSRTGTVPVGNSTILTFRIGGLAVGNGYSISLTAKTNFNNDCAGSASFNVVNSGTTRVSVLLLCGATDNQGDVIVDGEFDSCPVITTASAVPGEVRVGGSIALTSTISHGDTAVVWTGAGGTFANANAHDTTFTCGTVGAHTLTVTVNGAAATCKDAETVDVICSVAAGCGNGVLDVGETCDDGNTSDTDACLGGCVAARCGDGFVRAGLEECDDNNAVDTDACSNTCTTNACGNGRVDPGEQCDGSAGCNNATCKLLGCGDGIVTAPETCDDSNTVNTDECVSCQAARCGDGFVRAGVEACDDGNLVNGDGCENNCSITPSVPGDLPQKASAACRDCRAANCTSFQGVFDLVAACFSNPDPQFVQECIDLKNCAYTNKCGYNATGAPACFCGTADLNACQTAGAANGPCQAQFFAAAHTTQLAELIGRFGDVSLPVGVAYYFQECDRDFCAACQPQ